MIWHAPGTQLPGDLLSSLSKRISKMRMCGDGYHALAQACLIERERREMVLAGQTPTVGGAVVLIEPRELVGAAEIVEALRTYAPATTCWMYSRDGHPALRGVLDSDVRSWAAAAPALSIASSSAEGPSESGAPAAGTHELPAPAHGPHLAEHQGPQNGHAAHMGQGVSKVEPSPEAPIARFALTSEELRMLLSADDDAGAMDEPPAGLRPGRRVIGGSGGSVGP